MTTQTLWIVVAVVVAVFLIAAVLGLVLRRQRRISLRESERLERESGPTPPRKGGSYKAESGFSFSAGPTATPTLGEAAPVAPPPGASAVPPEAAPTSAPQPGVPGIAPEAAPQAPPPDAPELRPAQAPQEAAPAGPAATVAPERAVPTAESAVPQAPPAPPEIAVPETAAPETAAPETTAPETTAPETTAPETTAPETTAPERDVPTPAAETVAPPAPERSAPTLPTTPYPPTAPAPDEPRSANGSAPTLVPPIAAPPTTAPPAPPTTAPAAPPVAPAPAPAPASTAPAPTAPAAPSEAIDPAEGRLDRLRGRLARSRSGFGQGLLGLLGAGELDEESWEDVEATLLQADLGPEMTAELVETLRVELARRAVRTPAQARQLLRDVLTDALRPELNRSVAALPHDGRPAVLLIVGVNGTGKTTTTGKLARVLVANGRHVVLGAADTFRAAAAEQLGTWGERAGATVVRGPEGADPASVAFDAVKRGTEEGADAVLLDTAGRLHTKTGLMDELGKVKRVVSRQAEVDEVLLVLDATTGQNGLIQARVFGDVVDVSGIVLTKLDGTAKGGIVFRVQRELGVPVKLVGLGEGPDDLAPFEPAAFVDALLT
ncbi:signal recognition particle-docking protein FtsY [Pseudonocardia charpentierae]|uniref:Signal recognition particle receptor FtsY n=1 Tax=Pseudonocardia charpentierae TaxID=3075545 RepID=A0ABU2NAH2_9PSEU|nr:signal recognition particle-docking protein FtsY [Pseudonocardia sp. DSM 45834]MDT0350942.1 signal recognition particle-docking protein FtsY [Pseudonocardia sp. DSM 45834]